MEREARSGGWGGSWLSFSESAHALGMTLCYELYIRALTLTAALRGKYKCLHLKDVKIGTKEGTAYMIT